MYKKALIIDACATTAVEELCDIVEEKIREETEEKRMKITFRYSSGYGDFPIDIQNDFLRVLDAQKKIGLMLSEINLLFPRKSVTAIIGIVPLESKINKKIVKPVIITKIAVLEEKEKLVALKELIKKDILIFDGAMGTMLQKRGLKIGENPEILNIKSPDIIEKIYIEYIESGSNLITTNTFGANEKKLKLYNLQVEEVIDSAINIAKRARGDKEVFIALDVGPIGELLEPIGTLSFDKAYDIFKRQIIQGEKSGADVILFETMTDLYELKAAVLAAKENSGLPILCTMTFDENGRTFTGCLPESMVLVLEGLGVDALGVNCSVGPKQLKPIVEEICRVSSIPVMVQPNAGLPTLSVDNEIKYDVTKEEFAENLCSFIDIGVSIVGGCCGTTPDYIRELVKRINGRLF